MMYFTGEKVITKEQKAIPKYKFAVMGAYDSLAGIMQVFAINFITSSSILCWCSSQPSQSTWGSPTRCSTLSTVAQYAGAAVVLLVSL